MKNKKVSSYFIYPVLPLIYTIYYFAMRNTAGVLTSTDMILCLIVGIICLLIIVYGLIKFFKNK